MLNKVKYVSKLPAAVIYLIVSVTCSDPFSYSPFEVDVKDDYKNTTEKNLNKIYDSDTVISNVFKVALIADSHYHYDNLTDAIADMNRRDFSFIIVIGDITENGLTKEFEIFHGIMSQANVPYLTVIGNHDYLSNGGRTYGKMYGPANYSFTFKSVKFIAWDNVLWESEKEPDYKWFEECLKNSVDENIGKQRYHHIIPLAHIPPSDQQMEQYKTRFQQLLKEKGISLSVHGHKHRFSEQELFDDGIKCLTVGSPQYRAYTELSISPETISIQKIEY